MHIVRTLFQSKSRRLIEKRRKAGAAYRYAHYHWAALPADRRGYWRWDYSVQRERSDAELEAGHELVRSPSGALWHVAHVPEFWDDGAPAKAAWSVDDWSRLDALIEARLDAVQLPPPANPFAREILFDGVTLRTPPALGGRGEIRFCFARSVVLGEDDWLIQGPIEGDLDFRDCELRPRSLRFSDCDLVAASAFDRAHILGQCHFVRTKFRAKSSFIDCTFEGAVNLHRVKFDATAEFARSTFFSGVNLTGGTFGKMVSFAGCEFFSSVEARRTTFKNAADFTGAHFRERAMFYEASFRHGGEFSRVTFGGLPAFEQAAFHPNTSFDRARFRVVSRAIFRSWFVASVLICPLIALLAWPTLFSLPLAQLSVAITSLAWLIWLAIGGSIVCRDRDLARFARAFRFLSTTCRGSNNRRDSFRLLRQELRATRLRGWTNPFERAASLLADLTTSYGSAFLRPMAALVIVVVGFAVAYWSWDRGAWPSPRELATEAHRLNPLSGLPSDPDVVAAAGFRVRNSVLPFSVWSLPHVAPGQSCLFETRILRQRVVVPSTKKNGRNKDVICGGAKEKTAESDRLKIRLLATLQSLTSVYFLFMLGLAIRRKFQVE